MEQAGGGRGDYGYWLTIPTRWSDNDMLGHLNNVLYFRFFEAVVVDFLIREGGLDWTSALVPFAVDIGCHFRRPLSFPVVLDAGLRIDRLGSSSVTYGLALFVQGEDEAAAIGRFVHVWVERKTEAPTAIPEPMRAVYQRFTASGG